MKIPVLIALAVLTISCAGRGKPAAAPAARPFSVPAPPVIAQSADGHAAFFAEHFWDNLDFSDTLQIAAIDDQNIANYVEVLRRPTLDRARVDASLRSLLGRAEAQPAMYMRFVDLLDKYLYNPNSPMRHETTYIAVLDNYLRSGVLSDLEKQRYRQRMDMALKNRPGAPAADFAYTLANGAGGTLYGIRAEYTLLFISNPGCPMCRDVTAGLRDNPLVTRLVDDGRMKVLVVYPDQDLELWREHRNDIPPQWINAYDKSLAIRDHELYDLQAIPTLYFLGRDKTVLIKDFVDPREINVYLMESGAVSD